MSSLLILQLIATWEGGAEEIAGENSSSFFRGWKEGRRKADEREDEEVSPSPSRGECGTVVCDIYDSGLIYVDRSIAVDHVNVSERRGYLVLRHRQSEQSAAQRPVIVIGVRRPDAMRWTCFVKLVI